VLRLLAEALGVAVVEDEQAVVALDDAELAACIAAPARTRAHDDAWATGEHYDVSWTMSARSDVR
jgi:hypothetical protein